MRKPMQERAADYISKYRRKKVWMRVVSLMAAFVVFVTTYALILPAITLEDAVYCGLEEHLHTEECYIMKLVCEFADMVEATPAPHVHTDACIVVHRELTCGLEETAGKPAVIHYHTDECYSVSRELVCGKEEAKGHTHSDECIQTQKVLVCESTEEGHTHTDECYKTEQKYVCGMSEGEGAHEHTDACYKEIKNLTCKLEDGEVLEGAVPAHSHTDACYTVTTTTKCPEPTETPEPKHVHTDECYERVLVCQIPEHVHELICYSDPNADVEDSNVWKRSVREAKLTGEWSADLVAVAKTQIGYKESTKNYQVNDNGKIKGYTRYGDWYGKPYANWCAMFVSFCLNYAEVPKNEFPRESDCEKWLDKLEDDGLYMSRSHADPKLGDVAFICKDGDGSADRVGIVSAISGGTISIIEGDSGNSVETKSYSADSDKILGYGVMPENPELLKQTAAPAVEPAETITEEQTKVDKDDATEQTEVITTAPIAEPTVDAPMTAEPTESATTEPTEVATMEPTVEPEVTTTVESTEEPMFEQTLEPTLASTTAPTAEPTVDAPMTAEPTESATTEPTSVPTMEPTAEPTIVSTMTPMPSPTMAVEPTPTLTPELGELICGLVESDGHRHSVEAGCYEEVKVLVCGQDEDENHTHVEECYRTEQKLICQLEESDGHHHTEACYAPLLKMPAPMKLVLRNSTKTLVTTKVSGEGTKYDKDRDVFTTNFRIDFGFTQDEIQLGVDYIYNYPDGIIIPDTLIGEEKKLYDDGGNYAGTYTFVDNGDGTCSVKVNFDPKYEPGETVTGHISFEGTLKKGTEEDGSLKITDGEDVVVMIPHDDIEYPGDETDRYDIDVVKSGSYVKDGDKLVYTVYVRSYKGTPDIIDFNDTINAGALNLGAPVVTVQKGPVQYRDQWNIRYPGDLDYLDGEWENVNVAPNIVGNSIAMSLPALPNEGEKITLNDGVWTKGTCYKITYTYDLSNAQNIKESPGNKVTVESDDNTTGQVVKNEDSITVDVDRRHSMEKTGTYEADKGRIKWQVTINKNNVNIAGAQLTDTMLKDILTVDGTDVKIESLTDASGAGVDVKKDAAGKIIGIEFVGVNGATNTNQYTLTYYTEAKGQVDEYTKTNTATFDPPGTDPDITDEETVKVPGLTARKSGVYDASTGLITWTIIINENMIDIAGSTLTDTMLEKATTITIDPDQGATVNRENGKITSITFTGVNGGAANNNKYTITYTTAHKVEWNSQTVTNKANFKPKDKDPIEPEATVTIPGCDVEKSCDGMVTTEDGTKGEITWTVTIDVPESGLPKGTVVKDSIASTGAPQWMTHSQITTWALNMAWGGNLGGTNPYVHPQKDIRFLASDGEYYTFEEINNNAGGKFSTLTYAAIEITFPDGLKSPDNKANTLSFTYKTTVDLTQAGIGKTTYRNRVDVDDKHAGDHYDYYKPGVVKTDGNDNEGETETSSEGELTWKVKVTTGEKKPETVTITDTLPQGVALDSVSIGGTELTIDGDNNISGEYDTVKVTGTYDPATGAINMTMQGRESYYSVKNKAEYVFTFNCHVDTAKIENYVEGNTYPFTNDVTVMIDETPIGSTSQTQEWTYEKPVVEKKVLDKTGSWDNDNRRLDYSVVINPDGKDLVDGEDTLTLTDTLKYNSSVHWHDDVKNENVEATMEAFLVQGSVKLYKLVLDENGDLALDENGDLVRGEQIKDWKWTRERKYNTNDGYNLPVECIITATGIPDSTPLIMEYAYNLSSTIPKGSQVQLPISNTARLEGTGYSDDDRRTEDKWTDATSEGAITTDKSYTFYKVEMGNYNKALPEAEFTVYECDSAGKPGAAVKIYTTNANGIFKIQLKENDEVVYKYNTLYMVKETKAPDGYHMPDNVSEYYFYFSKEGVTSNLPETIPSEAIDLSKNDKTEYVDNIPNVYTFDKFYKADNGTDVALPGAEFVVYECDNQGTPGETVVKTYTTNSEGVFKIQQWIRGDGTEGYRQNTLYMVKEIKAPDGYHMPDPVPEYYFYFSKELSEGETSNLPEKLPAGLVDLSKEEGTASAENLPNVYTFNKFYKGNGDVKNALPGAQFSVYECDKSGAHGENAFKTYTTGSDGSFKIQWLKEDGTAVGYKYNTLYMVKETKAPDGFKLPDQVPEYYFYFSKELSEGETSNLPEDMKNTVDLSNSGRTENVENILNAYVFNKFFNSENNGKTVLPGAKFAVYRCDANTGLPNGGSVKTYTTDANGSFKIQWMDENGREVYQHNTLYLVKETTPPDGFKLPEQVPEYYFYFSKDSWKPSATIANGAVDLSQNGGTEEVENIPDFTSIEVDKKWFNVNDVETNVPGATKIEFQLYRIANVSESGDTGGDIDDGLAILTGKLKNGPSMDSSNEWINIDKTYPVGTKLTFKLQRVKENDEIEPVLLFNDERIDAISKTDIIKNDNGWEYHVKTWTYSVELRTGSNTLFWCTGNWYNPDRWSLISSEVTAPSNNDTTEPDTTEPPSDEKGKPYGSSVILSSDNNWHWVKNDLPKSWKDENGKVVNYTYYVRELTKLPGYTTTIVNNDGITEGNIIIENHKDPNENPSYELPATGGTGTTLYTMGGLSLIAGVSFFLLYNKKKHRKEGREFS